MNETDILWTDVTWNPMSGCQKVSAGCKHCYAELLAEQKRGTRAFPDGFELTIRQHKLSEPKRLKAPSLVFVNSMSDLFWSEIPATYRDQVIDVIESTPQHQYQVLTKRPEAMLEYSRRRKLPANFWAGATIESQATAHRADVLREIDVPTRFVSNEPMLSPLQLDLAGISWVITGGESGPHLMRAEVRAERALVGRLDGKWTPREDRKDWVRGVRDQCAIANVPFFFKQWGGPRATSGGREIDGRTWDGIPAVGHGALARANVRRIAAGRHHLPVLGTDAEPRKTSAS